jgi:hypothetical protein
LHLVTSISGIFLALFLLPIYLVGQDNQQDTVEYCNPRVNGIPPPTGISLSYERVMDYRIQTTSNVDYLEDGEGEVNYNRRIKFKLKVPIINKDRFKLTYGFHYSHEEFRFEKPEELKYSLYKSLENKPLKSLGNNLYFMFPQKNNTFYAFQVNFHLNGDYYRSDMNLTDFLKISAGPIWGKKPNDNVMYGFGFAYSYTFGDPSITPLIAYYQTFNDHWGIEAMLPLEAKLRYNMNKKSIWYLGAEARGASYNIGLDDPALQHKRSVELRHSEIKFKFSLEQEIYDFLWLSLQAGYRYNLNFNLAESNHNRSATNFFEREYIAESQLEDAFFFNVSLNIKPPKKWYKD